MTNKYMYFEVSKKSIKGRPGMWVFMYKNRKVYFKDGFHCRLYVIGLLHSIKGKRARVWVYGECFK